MDRRKFVQSGLAVPAASMAAGLSWSAPSFAAAARTLELERFIYDLRFGAAHAVAQGVAAKTGVELAPIADDLMDLWYDELDLRWKERPMALAGITLQEALFVLETFALDRGMRVVFRGRHGAVESGMIGHEITGPAALVAKLTATLQGTGWQAGLADALTQCPLGEPKAATTEFVTSEPRPSLRDVPLYSWIIAPRTAVALTLPG